MTISEWHPDQLKIGSLWKHVGLTSMWFPEADYVDYSLQECLADDRKLKNVYNSSRQVPRRIIVTVIDKVWDKEEQALFVRAIVGERIGDINWCSPEFWILNFEEIQP